MTTTVSKVKVKIVSNSCGRISIKMYMPYRFDYADRAFVFENTISQDGFVFIFLRFAIFL